MSSGARVVLFRFRSLAGCELGLSLVFALPGLLLLQVVVVLSLLLFRGAFPVSVGPGLLPVWRWALVCQSSSFRLLVLWCAFRLLAGTGSVPVPMFGRGITVGVTIGFPLSSAWLGAPLPGWAVLATACPGFLGLAPIRKRPGCQLRGLRLASKQNSYQDRTLTD